MIPFTPDERRAQFAPSQNVGGPVDPDILDIIGERPQPTMAQQVQYEVPEPRPIDPDVIDIVNQTQMPMMASLMGASQVNPDQAAEAKRLGSQIGVGQDIALRNLEDVRKRAFMADVQRRDIARANPVLAGFLSDPTFANEASDDIEPLSKFERAMDYIANIGQAAIDIPGEFGAGFRTGQVLVEAGMLGSTAQLRGRATEDEIQKWNQYQAELQTLSGDVGFWRQFGEYVGQYTRAGEEAVKGGVTGGVAAAGAALLAGQLGPQVFLPEEIVTVPAATLFGVGAGIASSLATTSARTMAGNNYMKNIESGMDPDVARVTALGVGVIGGALELFGMKLVAAPFKGLWSKVVSDAANDALVQPTVAKAVANAGLQYSKAVGGEIGTEVGQQITEIAFDEIAGYASDPNFESRFSTPEGRLGIREELKDIIVRTALGMSVLGGIGPGANLYVDTRRAGKAVRSQQAIQSVVEAVNAANLKRRDPDALEAFGNAALRETPAFIRGDTLRGILDANEVSNAEIDAIVPGLSTKIQEAVNADNFVSIPLAQFGVRLAGTKVGDAMVPHLTVDPTAMTPAELEAFNANVQEFTALAAAEYEAKTQSESAFVQEADQVATTMRERLIAAGRDPALAEVESLVHQAFVVTQAARQGKTPAQFEAESGLREIVGAEMPAAPLEQANRDLIASVDAELGGIMDAAKEASRAAGKTRSKDTQAAAFKAKQEWIAANPARYKEYRAAQRTDALENERVREAAASALAGKIDESLATAAQTLTDAGFVLDYESPAPSKSRYYRKGNTLIRLSDHEIPVTPERAAAREAGVQVPYRDFVFDGTAVDAELIQDLEAFAARTTANIMEQASRIDADYMAAVKRGDTATAQRMVDQVAKAAGYNETGYHGLGEGVLEGQTFDPSRKGKRTQAPSARMGFFFASRATAQTYAAQMPVEKELRDISRAARRVAKEFITSIPKKYRDQIDLSLLEEQFDRGDQAFMPDDETMPLDIEEPGQFVGLVIDDLYDQFPELIEDVLGVWPEESKARAQWAKDARKKYLGTIDPDLERFLRESRGQAPALINAKLRMQNPLIVDFEGKEYRPESYANVIARAKNAGNDSVIIRNTYDTMRGEPVLDDIKVVFSPEQIKSADAITRDEAGNIVPLSRRFDITSPRIFEQAAVQPRLMAVHNLSADNLQFADQMGGLAVPSIGVITQERGGVESFGEITLLGTKEMADPATSRVFSSDAYSARFPSAEWPNVPSAKADKFVEQLRDVAKKYDDRRIIDETFDAMVNNPNAEKVVGYWMRSMAVRALFLSENGIDIAPVMRAKKTLSGLSWDQIDALRTAYEAVDQNLAYSDMEASPEYQALKDRYAAAIRQKFEPARDDIDSATIERWALDFTPTTLSRLQRDMADTERTAVDSIATGEAIDAAMDPLKAEFKSWVDTKVRNQFGAPFIRIGRTRKPYTLNNIVDVMTSEKVRGEEKALTFGAGAARAAAATEFVDLEQVREAAKSAIVNPDEYAKASKSSNAELEAYRNAVIDYTTLTDWRGKSDTWAALDGSMRALATYGTSKRKGPATMRRVLAQEGFASERIPNDLIDQAIAAAETLFNAPVPYFEAKPQRAVRLGEFGGAVIPSDASQEVRDILERNGVAYMTYLAGNEEDRQRAVRQMAESPEARGEVLFQAMPGRGPARGGYDPSRLKILFGKGADFTTGAHELTHYYVDYYTKQALAGTAAPQMLADLDIMFKFMGVAGATPEERLAAFNAMPFETSRPLIETITYNAEIYLFEGKAPSLELAGVFDRMLAFFRRAYKSIADFVTQQREIYRREFGRELPELSDELRQVFDRMLADERQIKQAQAVAQMRGQFTVKPEGMDDAEWAAYQEMAGEATNAAIADMTKASLRQMEWLSRARSRIIKDMQARHTAQRKEVRERVQREVQQNPLYRAMAFLRRGQVVAPDGTVTEAEGVHRIDRVLAAEFAPTVDLARLGGRFGVLQDDGLHPDIVAEMFGYPAGATLLQALADANPMREVVEDRTDAEMLRLYGEMNTPAAREQEIQKALHNEARARLVGVELRFMGKIQQPVRVLLEAARQAAQQAIGRRRIVEIRPSEFVAAEAKASREVTAAMQENKPDVAVRAKRAQLLNNQLAKAALEARDEIDNGVRYLRRVLRDSNRQRMGADVADQIASLLDRFNIAPMTADEARRVGTLAEFLATLEDRGLVPDIAEAIGMRDTRIPYKNMTVTEFRDLVDAVKQLEYIGKNERKILLAKEKAEFESVRDEIVASVIDNAGDRKANARTATTNIGRAVTAMKGFAAAHLKAASIVRILDGGKDGGPLWNYLIRSANEAGDSETSMRAEATADLTKILEPVFRAGKLGGKGVFFPTINRSLNREARLVVALNMGNSGNMQRLLDGEGWSIEAVMPVLQSLTEDELNTVQQIWDYFEKYRPMIGQKERRLYGKEPAWVDPQPLVVRSADGKTITLRGGYYPIKYDPKASMRAETMSEAEEAKRDLAGAYTTATTRRSFTKARVRKVEGRPLLYTLAGMYGGINDVIHDLTWHEWLITANRLMRSNSFDDAVRNRYGPEYVAQLKNWIKDVAAGERGVQNEAEMALNFLRQGISSAGLGFNIVSAAMQITGFNQSIVRLGAGNIRAGVKWMGRGIAYTVANPMLAMQEVNEKSEFMRNRSRTQFRELNEIRNMVQGQSIAMRRVQMGTYFLMMRMQRMVDVPTWHGAYEKAMHEGRDEETAIALADQAVIDSQGGGMVKDLARVERGGPAVKLFTVFYGYMNTVYNMAAVQTMTNKNKGRLAADYAMLFVVPVVLSYMLKQALIPRKGDEEEEWDMGKIGRELAAEQLSYLMGTMVIAREFGEVGKMIFGVEGPRMGYGGPAGLRAIGETYQFATQASQGEFDRAFRKSAVNMIGAFTGLPSAQVNRTLDGLEALYEGETENVLAPLTGAKKR